MNNIVCDLFLVFMVQKLSVRESNNKKGTFMESTQVQTHQDTAETRGRIHHCDFV